jgi:hypothetical protein
MRRSVPVDTATAALGGERAFANGSINESCARQERAI